jgi:hypothetical protein
MPKYRIVYFYDVTAETVIDAKNKKEAERMFFHGNFKNEVANENSIEIESIEEEHTPQEITGTDWMDMSLGLSPDKLPE